MSGRERAFTATSPDDITILERNMPLRLIDTYTGLILKRSEITSLLRNREDYRAKFEDAMGEASYPIDLQAQSLYPGSKLRHLQSFTAEYLAYAMFSHRWGEREITISDVREAKRGIYSIVQAPPSLHGKWASDFLAGAKKLQEFCCMAAKCGYRWAWADTCCIDGGAYGEQSESINSMFKWYRNSDLTIVYLEDVDNIDADECRIPTTVNDRWFDNPEIRSPISPSYPYPPETSDTTTLHDRGREGSPFQLQSMKPDTQVESAALKAHLNDAFPNEADCVLCRGYRRIPVWFTRGWTLQELLASKRLRFYSKRWTLLEAADDRDTDEAEDMITISSFKYRARLVDHRTCSIWLDALASATDIPIEDIVDFKAGPREVKKRLSWAARRATTKDEDMAYSLLGIFDISLPAMYGEGSRAFFRLQEELIKHTDDASLFDWSGRCSSFNSFLAEGPGCFIEPDIIVSPKPDQSSPISRKIRNLVTQTVQAGLLPLSVVRVVRDLRGILDSPKLGHNLVRGGLQLSMFEYQVKRCRVLDCPVPDNRHFHYALEADGLEPAMVTFDSPAEELMANPKQYYICRVWDGLAYDAFRTLLEYMKGHWAENVRSESHWMSRFFSCPFVVYLVHVKDGRWSRVGTVNRVVSAIADFSFRRPVERFIQ